MMGRFIYEGTTRVEIEDRALSHLQLVMTAKLRRAECFTFSWREDPGIGGGRISVWVHPRSALAFRFFGSRAPSINRRWVTALAATANSSTGLYLVSEPGELASGEKLGVPADL